MRLLVVLGRSADNTIMPPCLPSSDELLPSGRASAAEPHLLRFGIRQLLLFVAGAAALLMLMLRTEGAWPLVIGTSVALVAAHVVGTLLGTRLRNSSVDVRTWRSQKYGVNDTPRTGPANQDLKQLHLPPASSLARQPVASRRGAWSLAIGGAVGLLLGTTVLMLVPGGDITWPGLAVGAVSCGVLGGWLTFLASSFWLIARHAWREANAPEEPPRTNKAS
jgi:hypothetical protein